VREMRKLTLTVFGVLVTLNCLLAKEVSPDVINDLKSRYPNVEILNSSVRSWGNQR
jgi:hypothetical protein